MSADSHRLSKENRSRITSAGYWIRFFVMLGLGIWLGHVLSETPRLADVRDAIYRKQIQMQSHGFSYPQRTSLVLLDDEDYWGDQFEARSPLRRDRLATLLDKLNNAGAHIVALDVDMESPHPQDPSFDFPPYVDEDRRFMEAVDRLCANHRHVVLATQLIDAAENYVEMPSVYDHLLQPGTCVTKGHMQLPVDMRQIPGVARLQGNYVRDSMSLAITRLEDPTAYANATSHSDKGFHYSQYLTPQNFAPRDQRQFLFSAHEVEGLSSAALHDAFAGRIVIIGGNWHAFAKGYGDPVDMHASPVGLIPGAMLHANYVEAILDHAGTFAPLSKATAEVIEICLAILLALVGAFDIEKHWKWTAFFISLFLSVLVVFVLMQNFGVFLDFAVPIIMVILHTLAEELLDHWHEAHLHEAKPSLKANVP